MQVAALDAREFLAELIEQASPQTTRVDQDVVLVQQGDPAAPRPARVNASRITRSTPNAVLTETSVAISWGVPARTAPPLPQ